MAAAITEAFHVKIKIAPIPYKKEKIKQKKRTFRLFKRTAVKTSALVTLPRRTTLIFLLTFAIAACCRLNTLSTTGWGSATYAIVKAEVIPKKRKRRKNNTLVCSFSNFHSVLYLRSNSSSFWIVEYNKGTVARTIKNTVKRPAA